MAETLTCPRCGQAFDGAEAGCPACGRLQAETACARHPDRTAEGQCVICGTPVCSDCDAEGPVHYSCPEHHDVTVIQGWAQVYSTSDEVEASLIRDNLQSEGLDASVLSQKDRSFAVDLGDLSAIRILVPAFQYRSGLRLVEQHMDAQGEVSFACPECGEAYEGGERVCGHCGQALV